MERPSFLGLTDLAIQLSFVRHSRLQVFGRIAISSSRSPESEAIPKSPEAESLRQILQHIDQKMDHHERVYQSHQKAYTQDFGPQREFSLLRNGCLKSHVGVWRFITAVKCILSDRIVYFIGIHV